MLADRMRRSASGRNCRDFPRGRIDPDTATPNPGPTVRVASSVTLRVLASVDYREHGGRPAAAARSLLAAVGDH